MDDTRDIRALSREYAEAIVLPWLEREFPEVLGRSTVGYLGHGSDVLGLDDALSRDHHHGIRVDLLLPESDWVQLGDQVGQGLARVAPDSWGGMPMRSGHVGRSGVSVDSRERFLLRTIGLDRPPANFREWMSVPEEDVVHVVHGQIWREDSGAFAAVRNAFEPHWPERVRLRRIAHWCRVASGMGTYALQRALLRDDPFYAATRFGYALRCSLQLAFLIDRVYFPYDKWLVAFVPRLSSMRAAIETLLEAVFAQAATMGDRLAALEGFADAVDAELVHQRVIEPHSRMHRSPTSGYRLLEHAYAEILKRMTPEEAVAVPVQDQIHLEAFHSGYVRGVDREEWLGLLGLEYRSEQ